MTDINVCIVLGTRPEIIKCSPVIRACENKAVNYFVVHSNQHYSENLDSIFFKELNLPSPEYNLSVGSGSHAEQTAKILVGVEAILEKRKPDVVLVQGDTNTVMAAALAASKLNIAVGHIEAGLRSFFREMPEETNRVITDHISEYLFAPSLISETNLKNEGIDENKIFCVGNSIVDAVLQNLQLVEEKSSIMKKLKLKEKSFILVTTHRAENIDNLQRLAGIIEGLELVADEFQLPIIYPIHPRAEKVVKTSGITINKRFRLIEPVGYFDFLMLQRAAAIVLTDSGGVQEETCILGTPCVTLRDNTERPETVQVGSNIIAGHTPESILKSTKIMFDRETNWQNPFGDGHTGERIIEILLSRIRKNSNHPSN